MTRLTFQLAADLLPKGDLRQEEVMDDAITTVLAWVQGKFSAPLPQRTAIGESFDAEVPGQSVRCIALPEDQQWSLRLVQPDAPYPGQPAVAGRVWTTEIALSRLPESVRFGIRVYCASLPYAQDEIRLTRPRVVVDLAARFCLAEARPLEPRPWRMTNPNDLQALRELLLSPNRKLPVFLLTQPDAKRLGLETDEFLLDADAVARRTLGLGYVVTMPTVASFEWTNLVGKRWSAFLGAVRTFHPGLNFDEDAPTDHPLVMAERVLAFHYRGLQAEKAFEEALVDRAHQHVANMRLELECLRFFDDAKIRKAELAQQQATDDASRIRLSGEQVAALVEKVHALQGEVEVACAMAAEAEGERNQSFEVSRRLQAQLDALRSAFAEKTGFSADMSLELPQSYGEMEDWVDVHLAGRLVLHPRAVRGLKDAAYADVSLVARALLLLASAYRNMQLGYPDANRAFEMELKHLGLKYARSIARHRAGEQDEEYFVKYPKHAPVDCFLEWHLRKGSSKDSRHCMGVYFFWDEVGQQVVVGSLPGHLENRMT